MTKQWRLLPALFACWLLLLACGPEMIPTDTANDATTGTDISADTSANDSTTDNATVQSTEGDSMTTASGLQYTEVRAGDGPMPNAGDIVAVHYTGTLTDGTVFDSSYQRNEPIQFPLGVGRVIAGWDEGIALMKQGGKATLMIPPELGYGAQGAGDVIPPNATLIFEVELVDILPGAPAAPTAVDEADYTTTASGLKYYDFVVGEGASPEPGQQVIVHYTGWLLDGAKFDSSLDRGQPFPFIIGAQRVIAGWDEGVMDMRVGGKRQLVIPPDLGYGERGAGGGVIPPNAALVFEVELLGIQ